MGGVCGLHQVVRPGPPRHLILRCCCCRDCIGRPYPSMSSVACAPRSLRVASPCTTSHHRLLWTSQSLQFLFIYASAANLPAIVNCSEGAITRVWFMRLVAPVFCFLCHLRRTLSYQPLLPSQFVTVRSSIHSRSKFHYLDELALFVPLPNVALRKFTRSSPAFISLSSLSSPRLFICHSWIYFLGSSHCFDVLIPLSHIVVLLPQYTGVC